MPTMCAVFTVLVFGACPAMGGTPLRDSALPEPDGLTLRVNALSQPLPGAPADIVATLRNEGRATVLVLSLTVSGPAGQVGALPLLGRSPAEVEGYGAQLLARLLVENVGSEARLPGPSRWEWDGKDEVVLVTALRPGEVLTVRGRAIGQVGSLGAAARVAAPPDRGLYRLEEITTAVLAAGEAKGWNATLALTARYHAAPNLSPATAKRPSSGTVAEMPELPDFAVAGNPGSVRTISASAPFLLAPPASAVSPTVRRSSDGRCDPVPLEGTPCVADDGYCVISWGAPGGSSEALWCSDGTWRLVQERNLPE